MKLATKVGFEVYMTLLRWQVNVRRRWREKGMLGKRKKIFPFVCLSFLIGRRCRKEPDLIGRFSISLFFSLTGQ